MLLSAAEKDSGVIPGPQPTRVRVDPYAFNRNRRERHWRNFQLGIYYPGEAPPPVLFTPPKPPTTIPAWMKAWQAAHAGSGYTRLSGLGDDILPVDITPQVIDPGSFPAQDMSPWLQPVTITPQVIDPGFASSSTTYADFLQPVAITPAQTDPMASFITPSPVDIQPPSFTISDQPSGAPIAATPTPAVPGTSGSTDYFGDILKLATVAGQTFVGYAAAQHGGFVPGVTGGIMPGAPLGGGSLTPAQYAMLTPAQRAQYAAMYPGSIPGSTGTDLLSQLFGSSGSGSSTMTWLLLGGAALTLVLVMKKS